MTDPLIKVERVSKKFCRDFKRSLFYGLQDLGNELVGRRSKVRSELRADEFWAVKDIGFELRRGEFLGLIGHNGAGKTTLLRMLCGLIKPDQGRIEMRGAVGALIALGAGFNPVLTGRENVYVNASVLGLTKRDVDRRMDEIIDFAEIRDFVDAPVQTYSSGMAVRLGFAVVAVLIRPDILLLDEVLAVGDLAFRVKCLNRIRELAQDAAVVFVSHDMNFVSDFCTRVIVMEHGAAAIDTTDMTRGMDRYFSMLDTVLRVIGSGGAQVVDAMLASGGQNLDATEPVPWDRADVELRVRVRTDPAIAELGVRVFIDDAGGQRCVHFALTDANGNAARFPSNEVVIGVPVGPLELAAGNYSVTVVLLDARTQTVLTRCQGLSPFRVTGPAGRWCRIVRPSSARIVE